MDVLTFVEIGACQYPTLGYLLDDNWKAQVVEIEKHRCSNFPMELMTLPAETRWEGYFVEPVPAHVDAMLQHPFSERPNAHIIQGALGNDTGFHEIGAYTPKDFPGTVPMSSLVCQHAPCHNLHYSFIVKTFTLEELLSYIQPTPTILRMDVEGVELEVLEGYSWKYRPLYLQIDPHRWLHGDVKVEWMQFLLKKNGYTILDAHFGDENVDILAKNVEV